jgi:flagellin-like protein|tara:strand:+ start:132 stop:605 length:474 start_codon:yes stop_codon:yes gene_type:complete
MKRKLGDKGVSPVIATVLLVGIVVVIGLIIFTWMRGITEESVTKFDKNAELVCDDIMFEASYSANTLLISNIGNVPIYQMKVKISKEKSFETKDLGELSTEWSEFGVNQGEGFSDSITTPFENAESITLTPVILGNSDKGNKAFTCDEKRFGHLISL